MKRDVYTLPGSSSRGAGAAWGSEQSSSKTGLMTRRWPPAGEDGRVVRGARRARRCRDDRRMSNDGPMGASVEAPIGRAGFGVAGDRNHGESARGLR